MCLMEKTPVFNELYSGMNYSAVCCDISVTESTLHIRRCGEKGAFVHCCWNGKSESHVENSMHSSKH